MGPNCINSLVDCAVVPVTKDQVRFIVNANTSQGVFKTPFGNSPRNPVRDEISNIANFSIIKNIKLGEKANFEFHTTFLNVMNHPNFGSVDPFIEDAGLHGAFNGFGDVRQTQAHQGRSSSPARSPSKSCPVTNFGPPVRWRAFLFPCTTPTRGF